MPKRAIILGCSLLLAGTPPLAAQEPAAGAAAIGELIQGLGTTTRVMMIGAHPDDEDTQLIAYLAKARHIQTAYLSLTRGDGGQNLIGNELGPGLGMIRTEELLAARRLDGGRQYFTRAFDFGFSKTIDETFDHWPKDSILKDVVEIVRAFRPQVIIAVFTGTPADGHGHHQYSGVMAREVFDAAADSIRFPASRVGGLQPWAPLKFYRLRRGGFGAGGGQPAGATLTFDVGQYDPLLGESYSEIATVSRSQHRSQGQGALPQRGPRYSGVRLDASRVSEVNAPEHGLFDGVDTTWSRFKTLRLADSVRGAMDSIPAAEAAVRRAVNLAEPQAMVPSLAVYSRLATRAASGVTCSTLGTIETSAPACSGAMGDLALALDAMRDHAAAALLDAAGVAVEATAPRELIAEHDSMPVTVSVYNQGSSVVAVERAALMGGAQSVGMNRAVPPDSVARVSLMLVGANQPTMPWWLRSPLNGDTFTQPTLPMITGEDRLRSSGADVVVRVGGVDVPIRTGPVVYRFADRARGEVRRPVATVPEVSVLLEHQVQYARADAPLDRSLLVLVRSGSAAARDVDVSLVLPAGLRADSSTRRVSLKPFAEASVYFRVQGRLPAGRQVIRAVATTHGESFSQGYVPVEYEHIRPQRLYRPSTVQLESVALSYAAGLKIGYVRGVGDNVPPMLEQLGLAVTELDPAALSRMDLSGFTTIVIGSRAYESPNGPVLLANTPALMRYARDGGTIVAQYGQTMSQPGILPYPVTQQVDRVTDETAAVRVLDAGSPLLGAPNKIADPDFANWVQERSSYMPHGWDAKYRSVFSLNDKDEAANDAAVLVAPVGKGTYVYTTFSFFRQLPAGNPGAARLFVNLLSANQSAANRPPLVTSPIKP